MQVEAMTVIGISTTWTTERIALLKNGIDAGLSCGQIAREIGVSRNAVIGKANRLGLSRFKGAAARQLEQAGTRRNAHPRIVTQHWILRALWAKPQFACVDVPNDSANRCTLFELQQWHCRWPLGDPTSENFGFCGNKLVDGLPYCPAHARIAYRPGTREAVVLDAASLKAG
jgi:GcrA cell cycle regulator